jgi:uncharacterized membrane protein
MSVLNPAAERAPQAPTPVGGVERIWARYGPRLLAGAAAAARCPALWLCLLAAFFYSALAVDRIDQHIAGSYDFGVIFQVVHGWAFHFYPSEPLQGVGQNEWGDHFSPILIVLAPLLWIHDAPSTLAVAQAFAISAAGLPIYFAVRRMHGPTAAAIACVLYLTCMEVQTAIGFDIHENMFEPLLIALAVERALAGRWTAASISMALNLLCYEDMGVMVFLFGLWAAWHRKWRHAAVLMLLGPVMVLLFTQVIMPDWGRDVANWHLRHFDYGSTLHADSTFQAFAHALEHPRHLYDLMVDNSTKRGTWQFLLLPVLFLSLASPITYLGSTTVVLLMASSNATHWSWHFHFYLQVAPLIIIGAFDGLRRIGLLGRLLWRRTRRPVPASLWWLRSPRAWRGAAISFGVIALGISVVLQAEPKHRLGLSGWEYLDGKLKRPAQLVQEIDTVAARVPSGRNVYVTNDLGTAVVARDTDWIAPIYADYVLFDTATVWTPHDFEKSLEQQGFHLVVQDGPVYLMAR